MSLPTKVGGQQVWHKLRSYESKFTGFCEQHEQSQLFKFKGCTEHSSHFLLWTMNWTNFICLEFRPISFFNWLQKNALLQHARNLYCTRLYIFHWRWSVKIRWTVKSIISIRSSINHTVATITASSLRRSDWGQSKTTFHTCSSKSPAYSVYTDMGRDLIKKLKHLQTPENT